MRVVIGRDGAMEIRPTSPAEDYTLRKWYEDWQCGRVTLRISTMAADGSFTHDEVKPSPQGDERG